jgi:hypothetical protein
MTITNVRAQETPSSGATKARHKQTALCEGHQVGCGKDTDGSLCLWYHSATVALAVEQSTWIWHSQGHPQLSWQDVTWITAPPARPMLMTPQIVDLVGLLPGAAACVTVAADGICSGGLGQLIAVQCR